MRTLIPVLLLLPLAGCAGSALTGLADADSSFSCRAPKGAKCISMDQAYKRSVAGNGASGEAAPPAGEPAAPDGEPAPARLSPAAYAPPSAGAPLRSAPLQLRVWIAPWEDAGGTLHDQAYVYVPVHSGRWLLETARDQAAQAFRRVSAPATASPAGPGAGAPPAPPDPSAGAPLSPDAAALSPPVAPPAGVDAAVLPVMTAAPGGESSAPAEEAAP